MGDSVAEVNAAFFVWLFFVSVVTKDFGSVELLVEDLLGAYVVVGEVTFHVDFLDVENGRVYEG